ncbi:hypothetical protein J7I98_33730 [Streptomyces sp. ISL-98]|uniref:hypothetical protein n=1 Tax=Streptomyces sp. ISL-98 TaxID=2819192 RepID=UPI001BE9E384|nr:hypothetical protein [Streptomyces sp. ISL-98]MBT2510709.1 hypothetical protein [Streptomyces sp. ISL-98]
MTVAQEAVSYGMSVKVGPTVQSITSQVTNESLQAGFYVLMFGTAIAFPAWMMSMFMYGLLFMFRIMAGGPMTYRVPRGGRTAVAGLRLPSRVVGSQHHHQMR